MMYNVHEDSGAQGIGKERMYKLCSYTQMCFISVLLIY